MDVPLVVTDFDGTLFEQDMGHVLCDRFAGPAWREINGRLYTGELDLPEAQRQMWGLMEVSLEELVATALEAGRMRLGGDALFRAAADGRCELVVASGGFDFYVQALLGDRVGVLSALYCNHLSVLDNRPTPEFPHSDLRCGRCAICKAQVVARHRGTSGRRVIFCGDGFSDCCVAGACEAPTPEPVPELYVIEGRSLHEHCIEHALPCELLTDFQQVVRALE